MPTFDLHQHLWPEAFIAGLARRAEPPRLVGSVLELAGERASELDLGAHDLEARLALLDRCELDVAVVSLQPTLGLEATRDEDAELLAEYDSGILELASASGGRIVPLATGTDLDGFAGACISAGQLRDLDCLAPLLQQLGQSGGYLFVHPGPATPPDRPGTPDWWPAVVDYTAQMQAAYATWLVNGVDRWPDLPVVFAILAGGAPFQLERLASRGVAGRDLLHPSIYFDTASYGRRALDLCLATFGIDRVVFGSDVPVVEPFSTLDAVRTFGDAVTEALCNVNPSRFLG